MDCDDPDCAADPACLIVGTEICSDGGDNDGDGDIDCDDSDCAGSTCCSGIPIVSLNVIVPMALTINGSNGVDCADQLVQSIQIVKRARVIVPIHWMMMAMETSTVQTVPLIHPA